MVNSLTTKEIVDSLRIEQQVEKIPNAIPVVEVNPKVVKNSLVVAEHAAATGSLTVISASTGITTRGDVYITCIHYMVTKDANCDVATGTINLTATSAELGSVLNLLKIPVITTTASSISGTLNFPHPFKVARNTAISLTGTYTAGLMSRSISITYFIDETNY